MIKEKPTVLIIDDEVSLLTMLGDRLSKDGLNVLKALDGDEGLRMSLENHPDLILLDIAMPRMDGLTMLGKLREDKWGANAQVILLTNLSGNEKLAASLEHGVFDYLVKSDWTMEEMSKKVRDKLHVS